MELGISLYPDFTDAETLRDYVRDSAELGYRRVFMSFLLEAQHFPGAAGPDSAVFDEALTCCREHGMQVAVDVNSQVMARFGSPRAAVSKLVERGIRCLRLDSPLPDETMAELVRAGMHLELNAADLDLTDSLTRAEAEGEVRRMLALIPPERLRGCFNFYPRTGTGLSLTRVREATAFLHSFGLETEVFVSSLSARPILHRPGRGVCTVEDLRDTPPEIAAAILRYCGVDTVLFGDETATQAELGATAEAVSATALPVPVVYCREFPHGLRDMLADIPVANRSDSAEHVLRCTAMRGISVAPARTGPRAQYAVTMDNTRSGQYSGEVQLMLRDMPACPEANVIGFVHPDAHGLVPFLADPRNQFRLVAYPAP